MVVFDDLTDYMILSHQLLLPASATTPPPNVLHNLQLPDLLGGGLPLVAELLECQTTASALHALFSFYP